MTPVASVPVWPADVCKTGVHDCALGADMKAHGSGNRRPPLGQAHVRLNPRAQRLRLARARRRNVNQRPHASTTRLSRSTALIHLLGRCKALNAAKTYAGDGPI